MKFNISEEWCEKHKDDVGPCEAGRVPEGLTGLPDNFFANSIEWQRGWLWKERVKLVAELARLREAHVYANELLNQFGLAVCDKHAVSWKTKAYSACPECDEVTR